MALPPPPPRQTGNPEIDLPAMIQWAHDFFKAAVLEEAFLQTEEQLDDTDDFDPSSLPDPASTSLAKAQDTANNAYILANSANNKAIAAQNAIDTKVRECGQITIANPDTTGTFTFSVAEANTNYFAEVQPVDFTGTPPIDATLVTKVTKTTAGVTITINAAPGVGNTVTFDVTIRRNS